MALSSGVPATVAWSTLRQWVKNRRHPLACGLYRVAIGVRHFEFPVIRPFHGFLRAAHLGVTQLTSTLLRIAYWTPLFKVRLGCAAPRLYLYSGMPQVLGPVHIEIGPDCRISGQTTFTGRAGGAVVPSLSIGRNVDIGWQTTIAVGRNVQIGDNVRIAGRAFLAGYPGHPLDARARALGDPDTEDQVGDIVLESDVWLATGVTVSSGVRIGRGTVVAAGSVVTRNLPAGVLAAGAPARVVRRLEPE